MPVVRRVLDKLGEPYTVNMPFRELSSEELHLFQEMFRNVDAVLLRPGIFSRPLIESAARLRIIAVHGAGVDQVDVPAATEFGIIVTNTPGANANAVAELTIGLMLSLLRRIPEADRRVRSQGQWGEARSIGHELCEKTVGLVGIGAVGRKVARLAEAFGAKIIAYDPYVDGPLVPLEIQLVDLGTLLKSSDIISVHVPLTPETRGMLSFDEFGTMKRGALLINTSRGGIIDEAALLRALENGDVAGAALDVLAQEPPVTRVPLFDLPNVVVTPHAGGSTAECLNRVAEIAAEEIARCFRGEKTRYIINPEVRPRSQ